MEGVREELGPKPGWGLGPAAGREVATGTQPRPPRGERR